MNTDYDQKLQNPCLYEQWKLTLEKTNAHHSTSDHHGQKLTTAGVSNKRYQAETTRILNKKYEHHSKIYTDGSKNEEKVGYAVVLERKHNKDKKISTKLDLQC
jgi:hypothetical protein